MNLDFELIMVVALAVCGVLWWVDVQFFKPRRVAEAERLEGMGQSDPQRVQQALKESTWAEYARSFFPVILIVLVLRSFLIEPFRIPSGSMMPTLLAGDFILVNKFIYGLRLPVLHARLVDTGQPQRGDVVVFRYPRQPSVDYIKRVIGLPGDMVGYYNKTLYINGKPVAQEIVDSYVGSGAGVGMSGASLRIERLDSANHNILIDTGKPSLAAEVRVPQGHYFVMGDNRDNSNDSRYWGFVPEGNLVGKAFLIWMNWDSLNGGVEWKRLGTVIK